MIKSSKNANVFKVRMQVRRESVVHFASPTTLFHLDV